VRKGLREFEAEVLATAPFSEGRKELGRLGIERGTNIGRRNCRIELLEV
jgi:hypothetical protein